MFRKINPWILFALLAVLALLVVLLLRMDARKQQGSFLRELISVDRAKTTRIEIITEGSIESMISLTRNDDIWMVEHQGKSYQAKREAVDQIFQMIRPMTPEQLVARDRSEWEEYQVDEASATRVRIFQGNRNAGDIYLGRINFVQQMVQGQQRPQISTFVRLAGSDDVYTVEGFLSSVFPGRLNHYRDPAVLSINREDVQKVSVSGPQGFNFELTPKDNLWLIDGIPADSTAVELMFQSYAWLLSDAFAEEEAEGWLGIPSHQLRIERRNAVPVEIKAYPADSLHHFFITSTQNPGSVFGAAKDILFESLFFEKSYFTDFGKETLEQ